MLLQGEYNDGSKSDVLGKKVKSGGGRFACVWWNEQVRKAVKNEGRLETG